MSNIQDDWFDKDRSETSSNRKPDGMFGNIKITNEGLGLDLYNQALDPAKIKWYIDTLEKNLNPDTRYFWNEARVTNSDQPIKKARDCVDFKMNYSTLG